MASGTIKYSALMTPHQEIYNGRSAKRWNMSVSGAAFPSVPYKVTKAVIKYDIRNVYASNRHMVVSRVDNGKETKLGDVPTGSKGKHTENLSTSVDYSNIKTIELDGVERWACQLRGGSYVEIEVTWEEVSPVVIEPPKPSGTAVITGKLVGSSSRYHAVATDIAVAFDGVDISSDISGYMLSMTYTDNEEDEADDLQLKLQDRDGLWLRKWLSDSVNAAAAQQTSSSKKVKGLQIQAAIRSIQPGGSIHELNCGSFELDSIKASGPPSTVTIKGTSLPFGNGVRTEERDKAWESYTLSKIGKEIAQRAGLGFLYDCPSDPSYRRVEQAKQTDIAFLQQLCHNEGFSLKASGGKLIVFDQEYYEALKEVATISWQDGSYTKYDLSTAEGDVHYAICKVRYYHPGLKKTFEGIAYADDYDEEDEDNRTLTITDQRVESASEAKALAGKLLRLRNKYERKCSFTMLGNPMLGAGLTIRLVGFGMWDGKYIIKQCKHEVGNNGYTTKITLRTIPDKEAAESSSNASSGSSTSGSSSSGSSNNSSGSSYWATTSSCTMYKNSNGTGVVTSLGKGTRITLLGSTSGSYTYIRGNGSSGYVRTSCIGKVKG